MSRWTYTRYVRLVLGGDTVEDLARHIAPLLTDGRSTLEQVRETLRATLASSEADAGDRVRGSRMLAYQAWRGAGFQGRLVTDVMGAAQAFADEGKCPECEQFGAHEGICKGPVATAQAHADAAEAKLDADAALHPSLQESDRHELCSVCGCVGGKHRFLNAMCPATTAFGVIAEGVPFRDQWKQTTFFKR